MRTGVTLPRSTRAPVHRASGRPRGALARSGPASGMARAGAGWRAHGSRPRASAPSGPAARLRPA
jgi:hypothetical protein